MYTEGYQNKNIASLQVQKIAKEVTILSLIMMFAGKTV